MYEDMIIVKPEQYANLSTAKYNVISHPKFIESWTDLAYTLGYDFITPYNPITMSYADFRYNSNRNMHVSHHVSESNSDYYVIHSGSIAREDSTKIIVSNISFEFIPETIQIGKSISKNEFETILATTELLNNLNTPIQQTRSFSKTLINKTTVSTDSTVGFETGLSVNYTINLFGNYFTSEAGFTFSYDYNFGKQDETLRSTEFSNSVSVEVPPKTRLPIKFIAHNTQTKIPFKGFAKMFYNITFEGPLSSMSLHVDSRKRGIFKYTLGNENISAEDAFKKESILSSIPNFSPWNWNYLKSNILSLGYDFENVFENGFFVEFDAKFENENTQFMNIEIGAPINLL